MKLRLICVILALVTLSACSPAPKENDSMTYPVENQETQPNTPQEAMSFSEHGLSFTVPELWAGSEFSMEFDEVQNDVASYDTRTFYALVDGVRTPIAMVSRFAKEQWDALVSADSSAEKVKLGESRDGKYVYTYLVKDDIVPETDTGKDLLGKLRKEATELKDKIEITE